jgi:hypothetical protein
MFPSKPVRVKSKKEEEQKEELVDRKQRSHDESITEIRCHNVTITRLWHVLYPFNQFQCDLYSQSWLFTSLLIQGLLSILILVTFLAPSKNQNITLLVEQEEKLAQLPECE